MPRVWCCFGFLVSLTVILIFHYLGESFGSNHIFGHVRQSLSADDDDLDEISVKEFEVVFDRWRSSNSSYTGVKTILYWNRMYAERHRHFMFGTGDVFRDCAVPHCYATPDRDLLDSIASYDAIMLHGIEMDLRDLPDVRSLHQRYIFFSLESPDSRPINNHQFVQQNDFYNWTMSYRLDSDIRRTYGRIRDLSTNEILAPPKDPRGVVRWRDPARENFHPSSEQMEIIAGKKKMAAWFVSHCETKSKRETMVRELQKHIEVDVYGLCGNLQCDKNNNHQCYDLLEQNYFFYLSFENTLCTDYVTEKFFLPLQRYIIPVVYNGADLAKFAPPHSYINVHDFENLTELTKYLIRLSKNPEEYASYFWWKKFYNIEDTTRSTLCDLCEKLHDTSMPRKSLSDFKDYYTSYQCFPTKI